MVFCDENDSVVEWSSEEVIVPYVSPVDGKRHRYFVDFYIKVKENSGDIKKYLIEIKPAKFVREPKIPKRKTKHFLNEVIAWGVNQAKWKYATEFCKDNGWEFLILTEKELGIKA